MAHLGFGDDTTKSPSELLAARRAVVIAEPGMGKTQLLHHLGELEQERTPLLVKLTELVAQLQPDDEAERVLAAALARARGFAEDVERPTRDGLDGNAYTLLFDALDEVASDRRADAVALLAALAARYPQNVMVITSRVNDDAAALEAAGFPVFRIARDGAWGRRYLEERGIPDARIRQLYEEVQTIGDLLAVPQYAALIGQRLAQESLEVIPATGFELMIEVGVKDAVQREAENLGYSAEQLYRWLRLLAVALELRGRVSAKPDELAEIPGPEELRTPEARERLVERALLQDIPDVAVGSSPRRRGKPKRSPR
jgi:transposase-like protein